MMPFNFPRIAGVVASFLAGVLVKLAADYGLTLDPEEVSLAMTTVMIAVYAFAHRRISKNTNPTDAATPKAAAALETKAMPEYQTGAYKRAE